jgi:hypothetical protein
MAGVAYAHSALAISVCCLAISCSFQPPPPPRPPAAETIVWTPSSEAGKRLKSDLFPDFERFIKDVRSSPNLPRLIFAEPGISIVRFMESGKKQGVELRFLVVPATGTDYSGRARHVASTCGPELVDLIRRYPAILASEEIDCFVIVFEWSTGVESQITGEIEAYPREYSTRFWFPTRSVVTESVILEIPKMLIEPVVTDGGVLQDISSYIKIEARYDRL